VDSPSWLTTAHSNYQNLEHVLNRLADSLSPYLLQHKDNPVDWFPWCEEAFLSARETDKPIFLSVGYAACHWCHVMERESFENPEIARFLNEHFISIKVDREERPDIDQIYMNAVQVMTGRGGWPMSVFLNHDRQPFFAGTYWPPAQKFGMPGFAQVLHAIADAWGKRRGEVDKHAGEITVALQQLARGNVEATDTGDDSVAPDSICDDAAARLMDVLDRKDGGFGGAPKFPHATDLELLLRLGFQRDQSEWIQAVELTLDRMAAGGIRDHIGGGFARYSVDAKWLVPHFEKMLYDNALLAEAYLHAYRATGHWRHAQVARETWDYLLRDMVDRDGGFHCSEDADSEGVEGKFYVWTPAEVSAVLGDERGERFCKIYDITEAGNFEGHSIPNLPASIRQWADDLKLSIDDLNEQLAEDRERLRQARETRVRPGRDDKVLTAWNALAIKSLALGGAVLDDVRYIEAAERAASFIFSKMMRADGRLLHAFRAGHAHLDGYLDDYAYTVEALIALYEATGETTWIERASRLADLMLAHFQDRQDGGFYYTADDAEALIARTKDWHDGSLVSGNASAAMGLLKLSRLVEGSPYREAARRTLTAGGETMRTQSAACGALLSALDRFWNDRQQIVLAVTSHEEFERLRPRFVGAFRPQSTISWVIGEPSSSESASSSAFVVQLNRDRQAIDGEPTIYQCHDFACDQPLVGDDAEAWLQG
jgi:uncharacterized protein YyaL (SSP411 family)